MKQTTTGLKIVTSYRVIYGDTDQMGVVYYANFLRWFERGRAEWLRQIGLPYGEIERQGFHFPVAEVTCRYSNPAHYDEVIKIETELTELGLASLTFSYKIYRESDNAHLANGSTKHACIDHAGHMVRIPKILEKAIAAVAK